MMACTGPTQVRVVGADRSACKCHALAGSLFRLLCLIVADDSQSSRLHLASHANLTSRYQTSMSVTRQSNKHIVEAVAQ